MNQLGEFIAGIPKPIRDFLEAMLSAGIVGAGAAVYGLNLSDQALGPRAILLAACLGFVNAVLAAARRGITPAV